MGKSQCGDDCVVDKEDHDHDHSRPREDRLGVPTAMGATSQGLNTWQGDTCDSRPRAGPNSEGTAEQWVIGSQCGQTSRRVGS